MRSFAYLFGDMFERETASFDSGRGLLSESSATGRLRSAKANLPSGPQQEFHLQRAIRPLFGKEGVNDTPIGTHPDFLDLEASRDRKQLHYACIMFVDIKGSTRLNLLYSPEAVYEFKNAVLKTCIETVRSLDGHVHRLMGDAVMAFFGGKRTLKEDAIADALNCATTLRALVEESIVPWMVTNDFEPDHFGIRIGIDFGDNESVLWADYGYPSVGEVTATGLPVDMASKLQAKAGKNEIMLGQSLLDYVDWPEAYSLVKSSKKGGDVRSEPYVTPNLTTADGNALNYRMRVLPYDLACRWSALPTNVRQRADKAEYVIDNPAITLTTFVDDGDEPTVYKSGGRYLDKELSLEFRVRVVQQGMRISFPLYATFTKTNHGKAARANDAEGQFTPSRYKISKKTGEGYRAGPASYVEAVHRESTLYRGLHTMECAVRDSAGHLIFRDLVAVLIR